MATSALRDRVFAFTGPICDSSPNIAAAVEFSGP